MVRGGGVLVRSLYHGIVVAHVLGGIRDRCGATYGFKMNALRGDRG
jgi:hypothetical protein